MRLKNIPDELVYQDSQTSFPYEKLSVIYNHVMRHVEYRRWARYIKKILNKYGPGHPTVMDIGCGTGEFIYELSRLAITADGCDPSPAMLKIAKKRDPSHSFTEDGLPRLNTIPAGKYNVFTCLYDTINYLPSLEVFSEAVNRVYSLLPKEGLFVFDAVSEFFCKHYFNGFSEKEVINSKFAYQRRSYFDALKSLQINEFSIHTEDGIFEEKHIQKIYPFSQMRQIIRNHSSFQIIAVFEDFSFFAANSDSNRAHFILKKSDSR
jgi:ubiquinone/menaquinone biosynthesis C-methylase UbiE